jgi:hypothetical protein
VAMPKSIPKLPIDLVNYILTYAPIISPGAKCINRLIEVYDKDHNWDLTKQYKKFYIKNILPFDVYYWWSNEDPEDYMYGPNEYNVFIEN